MKNRAEAPIFHTAVCAGPKQPLSQPGNCIRIFPARASLKELGMEGQMKLFNVKEENTDACFRIALEKAAGLKTDIVAATTSGATAEKLMELAAETGFSGKVVIVTHAYGSREKGTNAMPEEVREKLIAGGCVLVTAAHALSGVERGLSGTFKGVYPAELIANTLRMFGAGTKVAVEIGLMAMDAGVIEYGKPVVCVGGTGRGADTAWVITPGYSACILETRLHECLCKPDLY